MVGHYKHGTESEIYQHGNMFKFESSIAVSLQPLEAACLCPYPPANVHCYITLDTLLSSLGLSLFIWKMEVIFIIATT